MPNELTPEHATLVVDLLEALTNARAHDYRSPEFTERLTFEFQRGGKLEVIYIGQDSYETEGELAAAIQRALVEGEET